MVSRLITLGKEAGVKGLFAGLGPRMSMSTPSLSSLLTSYTFWDCVNACSNDGRSRELTVPVRMFSFELEKPADHDRMYGAIKNALGARPGLEIHADEPVK